MSNRINVYMPEGEQAELRRLAKRLGVSHSKVFRLLVTNFALFEKVVTSLINQEEAHERISFDAGDFGRTDGKR